MGHHRSTPKGRIARTGYVITAIAVLAAATGLVASGEAGAVGADGTLVVEQRGLDFGLIEVGDTATEQVATVRNAGTGPLTFTNIHPAPDPFARTTTCSATLAPAATCEIRATFTPTTPTQSSAEIAIESSGGASVLRLRGVGDAGSFPLTVTPRSIDFGPVPVGTTTPAQQVLISNPTSETVEVRVDGGPTGSANFGTSTSCSGPSVTLTAGASCSVQYDFRPQTVGSLDGAATLRLTLYDGGVPTSTVRDHAITVTGEAIFPVVVSPTSLDFGPTPVGGNNPDQFVTITNPTNHTVQVGVTGGSTVDPEFPGNSSCTGTFVSLAPGASCNVDYGYAPGVVGAAEADAMLRITPYSAGVPTATVRDFAITLAGEGIFPVVVSSTSLDFGPIAIGTTSGAQQVTITNPTGQNLQVQVAEGSPLDARFAESSTCIGPFVEIAPGTSCSVQYTFSPTAVDAASTVATLQITPYADSLPTATVRNVAISLTGEGYTGSPAFPVGVSPTALDFGPVPVGSTAPAQRVIVSNPTFEIVQVEVTGGDTGTDQFTKDSTCGGGTIILSSGTSCYIEYTATPAAVGPVTASATLHLTLYSDGLPTSTVRDIPLTFAADAYFPIAVSSTALDFGPVPMGGTSPGQRVTVSNPTSETIQVKVAGGGASNAPFVDSTTCGSTYATLAPGTSCYVEYVATPTAVGPVTGSASLQLAIYRNGQAIGVVRDVPLTFAADAYFPIVVSPTGFDFGAGTPGQRAIVTNPTSEALQVQIAADPRSGNDFLAGNACGTVVTTLAPGETCFVVYEFRPVHIGLATGTMAIRLTMHRAGIPIGSVRDVEVTLGGYGTGAGPLPTLSPFHLDFGPRALVGSTPLTATLSNDGTAPLTNIIVGFPTQSTFLRSTTCGVNLAPGANCTVSVSFRPTAGGPVSDSIQIYTDGGFEYLELDGQGPGLGDTDEVTSEEPTTDSTAPYSGADDIGTGGTANASGTLPRTGRDLLPITATGLALVVAGALALLASRRRRAQ